MTLNELERSILVTGDDDRDNAWDTTWRLELVQNLRIMVNQLWDEGFTDIYIDGSFATDKLHPGDIDGYFVCQNSEGLDDFDFEQQLCDRLNTRDKNHVWTWKDKDRKRPAEAEKGQLPMWFRYHVEIWPEYGQWSGQIHPLTHQKLTHAELFRITKQGEENRNNQAIEKVAREGRAP